jgi:hypothetical protein
MQMLNKSSAIVAIALFAGSLAVSSADAQTNRHRLSPAAAAARAQAHPLAAHDGALQSPAVYGWGKYQGQDPDANVRLMLQKDYHN